MLFNTVEEAIADIRDGKMIVVVDDEDRENEGDLLMAAEKVTPQAINFMATFGRGMICVPLSADYAKRLDLPMMVQRNNESMQTAFTVSVDHSTSTTGISAFERAKTILELSNPNSKSADFHRPGHIFPLIANDGGVLKRAGHTEAAVDLAKLAGLKPAGVICEIISDDGTMAKGDTLSEYAKKHNLKIITVADIIKFRRKNEIMVKKVAEAKMPTRYGDFIIVAYEDILIGGEPHIALIKGNVTGSDAPVLVRVHSECLTGDVFHSLRCDCGEQLNAAMEQISAEGRGIILYMRQEGRGIGLANKIKAYALQDTGSDTVEANIMLGFAPDLRDYGTGAQILCDIGVKQIRLMTNNPKKVVGLSGYCIDIVERVPLQMRNNKDNSFYMQTKKEKMGHILS